MYLKNGIECAITVYQHPQNSQSVHPLHHKEQLLLSSLKTATGETGVYVIQV